VADLQINGSIRIAVAVTSFFQYSRKCNIDLFFCIRLVGIEVRPEEFDLQYIGRNTFYIIICTRKASLYLVLIIVIRFCFSFIYALNIYHLAQHRKYGGDIIEIA
jgi:hypothetical protein